MAAAQAARHPERQPSRLVSAPVRIADAATVGLLRPGDRVDVIAASGSDAKARLVAEDVRVADVPGPADPAAPDGARVEDGALVVLAVERRTAAALAGAGASGRLVVAVSRGR
ncbi:hypothetical protein GCM10010327_33920 [Streptomyces nitrosporeus]|nr:RcpC/CpaB family pilus assembly protein [Streptomyces nitrosporeus]GGZ00666.1 hypothetical protein GCM10010327_33920 [Streptomyces nitrosporeus]